MSNLDRNSVRKTAWAWWISLQPSTRDGKKQPGDRATLARLRRATVIEAAADPAVARLYDGLGFERDPREAEQWLGRVAVLGSLLAEVRDEAKPKLARTLGPPAGAKNGEGAILSPLRLRRLLAARGDAEIAITFRRAIAMLGNKANVGDLAWQVLNWDLDEIGDRTRTLFAFDYHNAGAYAPPDTGGPDTDEPNNDTTDSAAA